MIRRANTYVTFEIPSAQNHAEADLQIVLALNAIDSGTNWRYTDRWTPLARTHTGETLMWRVEVEASIWVDTTVPEP